MARLKVEQWRGQVRLPIPIAEWLQVKADANYRSVNAEFVEQLRRIKESEESRQAQGSPA